MNEVLVLTFVSHYDAIRAKAFFINGEGKSVFSDSKEHFNLSPTPRRISSTCATCLIGDNNTIDAIKMHKDLFLSISGVEGIYILKDNKKEVIYEHG